MPDYRLGKIYRLSIGHLVYIGSTTQPQLSMRLGTHKSHYNLWVKTGKKYMTSFELFKVGTPKIELVESFPCNSRDELRAREGHYQRENVCVNQKIAGQTREEYYIANQDKYSERMKHYRAANQQKITEQQKHYRNANKDKISEHKKHYYDENKDKMKQNRDENKEKRCEYDRMRYAHNKRIELLTLFIQSHVRKVNSI